MATASTLGNSGTSRGFVAASYCDEDRLFLVFRQQLDEDMAPLAEDFSVVLEGVTLRATAIDFLAGKARTLVVLLLEEKLPEPENLTLRYRPTQWLMCDAKSGDGIESFDEALYLRPIDTLDPSLRLRTKFEPAANSEGPALSDARMASAEAAEFRIQLRCDYELDTNAPLDVEDFRAETQDRWVKLTSARYLRNSDQATSDILLELSEPLDPGTEVTLSYRSPEKRLRTLDGRALASFSVTTVIGEAPDALRSTEIQHESPAPAPSVSPDAQEGDKVQEAESAENVTEPATKPEPTPIVVRAKTVLEESPPPTAISSLRDPDVAANLAEKTERFKQAMAAKSDPSAPPPKTPFVAKLIYIVPVVVLVWLVFVIGVYLATLYFDTDVSTSLAGPQGAAQTSGPAREQCNMTAEDGSTYQGECLNGERDGFGSYVWSSGNRYDGEWRRGRRHGQGTLVYSSGAVYKGEYREGVEDGQGTMVWPNGANYDGAYRQGKFHGRGTYVSADGNRFEGVFENGSMTQDGTCIMRDGEEYAGPCRG